MKLTLVLRDKKNALKLSTKTIESFMERIKSDTKDRTVGRRREQFRYTDNIESYDRQFPSHLIYPSAEFEKDENDNLRMKTFNGVVALAVDGLETTVFLSLDVSSPTCLASRNVLPSTIQSIL